MKQWKWMLGVMAIATLSNCSDNELETIEDVNVIKLEAVHPAQTRLTDTNFESKDRIGVYVVTAGAHVQVGGNVVNNEVFTYNGSNWTSARRCYWNEGLHDVYAYYPYGQEVNDITDYRFTVATDQNAPEDENGLTGYEASDFLWAKTSDVAASADPVKLKFSHRMSKLVVRLEKGAEYDGDLPESAEVLVHNTVPQGSVNLMTGDISKADTGKAATIKARQVTAGEYHACIVPQRISNKCPLVEILVKDVAYLMEGTFSFQQGYMHTIVLTLAKNPDQTKIEIGGSVEGWN